MMWATTGLEVYRSGGRNLMALEAATRYTPPLKKSPVSILIELTFTQKGTEPSKTSMAIN
jgi:hypothetical protein